MDLRDEEILYIMLAIPQVLAIDRVKCHGSIIKSESVSYILRLVPENWLFYNFKTFYY